MEEQHEGYEEKDLLRMFTNEIIRFKVLKREEEDLLFERLRDGRPDVINRLIEANLRFALSVVFRYWRPGYPLMNMVSGACLGLVRAGKAFKPEFGCRFTTYAFPAIKQEVIRAIHTDDLDFCKSLDVPIYEDGDCLKDRLASEESTPEEEAETKDLTRYLAVLTTRERRIIELRFWEDKTFEEIGLMLGIVRESVRKSETRALLKLRLAMKGADIKWQ